MGDRHRNGAGTGAHIQYPPLRRQALQRQFDQQFGFRTGNQYIGSDAQHQAVEFALADDIGNRLAVHAPLYRLRQRIRLLGRRHLFRSGDQFNARKSRYMTQQDAGFQCVQRRLPLQRGDAACNVLHA